MALGAFQRRVVDTLLKSGNMSIKELSRETGFSTSFIRQQVDMMVAAGELEVDKKRQPFVYDVPAESPEMRTRRAVEKAKEQLLSTEVSKNKLIAAIKSNPSKETWTDAVPTLRALAQAIEELDKDGLLIDTLGS